MVQHQNPNAVCDRIICVYLYLSYVLPSKTYTNFKNTQKLKKLTEFDIKIYFDVQNLFPNKKLK